MRKNETNEHYSNKGSHYERGQHARDARALERFLSFNPQLRINPEMARVMRRTNLLDIKQN